MRWLVCYSIQRRSFSGANKMMDYLVALNKLLFSKGHTCSPSCLSRPTSCRFPSKNQAGIELLRSFLEIFTAFEFLILSFFSYINQSSIKILAHFIRRHIPSVKTPQFAIDIRYIPRHHASHYFSDSCFRFFFFLFPCWLFPSLP